MPDFSYAYRFNYLKLNIELKHSDFIYGFVNQKSEKTYFKKQLERIKKAEPNSGIPVYRAKCSGI